MELNVKVKKILSPETFTRHDGTVVVKNSFIGETTKGSYDKIIKFDVLNAESFDRMYIEVGCNYNVSFEIESKEWHDKYFTSVIAWRVVRLDVKSRSVENKSGSDEDVPF